MDVGRLTAPGLLQNRKEKKALNRQWPITIEFLSAIKTVMLFPSGFNTGNSKTQRITP